MRLLVCAIFLLVTSISSAFAKSDAAIEADIRARLSRSKIGVNGFSVKVQNGTAIWTGKTSVIQHKGAATRMAKSAGAARVDNRITIDERAREKAAARLHNARTEQKRKDESPGKPTVTAPAAQPDVLAPPPVRRAVVKKP